jgi:hypothetical protein
MTTTVSSFRVCLNIKSRANPDIQCHLSATHGDYCSRHYKNPKPFRRPPTFEERTYTRTDRAAAKKIQGFWRARVPFYRYVQQGPAVNAFDLAVNDTELYSLEPVTSIPKPYFISFSDERKSIWIFDVRSLVQAMASGTPSANPYNRNMVTERAKERIHRRIAWLRSRLYPVLHISSDVLTPEQCWNHKVLDIFLKIEAHGHYVSCDWYHKMELIQHVTFYKTLLSLWEYRLGLTRAEKERIVPGHEGLFRYHPSEIPVKSLHWWEKNTLALMETFVTRATDKEQQKLGTMYVLMALVQVSRPAAEALPWLL